MPSITGTLTASGDSATLITVPAGGYLQVLSQQIAVNSAAITVTVKVGGTNKWTGYGVASAITYMEATSAREPLYTGASGDDLLINLSGAASSGVAYNIQYVII